eukprot:1395208-Amorphochlora_amoeboformis.AAC.3
MIKLYGDCQLQARRNRKKRQSKSFKTIVLVNGWICSSATISGADVETRAARRGGSGGGGPIGRDIDFKQGASQSRSSGRLSGSGSETAR